MDTPKTPEHAATPEVVAAPPPAPSDQIDIEYFSKIKLRVAKVLSAEAVPKSKKLIKLQIDLGPLGQRQILAGIAEFKTPESLVGQKIVVVANLQPAKLMGHESQGMLLAAGGVDGIPFALLQPAEDLPEGAPVR